jgi:crotonobetainyl-CoA:carnitine CoA-transferase CaiB-like acyl-CoA transferase
VKADMLNGIRVVDLTSVVLGPYATMMLADLGAEVIKVESLEGDVMRHANPARNPGMGAVYLNSNRGKRSIAVNLKDDYVRKIMLQLCATADVFIHSMRSRAIESLGLCYEQISEVRKDIIYCSAWGFDQRGPLANAPAYDDIIQGACGIAALNHNNDGSPKYVPSILADKVTSLFTTNAILAALYHRLATGEGQAIEVPMMECLSSFMLVEHMAGATFDPVAGKTGYQRMLAPSRKPYRTQDGFLSVLPYSRSQWQRFLAEVGRDDLIAAAWVIDNPSRSERIDELYAIVESEMLKRPSAVWAETFQRIDIPYTPVNSLDDLLTDKQLQLSEFFESYQHPTEGQLQGNWPPVRHFVNEETVTREPRTAPRLGEQTRTILSELGVESITIDALIRRGAISTVD